MPQATALERWTYDEDKAFRVLYPDYSALQRRFPRRTLEALKGRAKALNIVRRRHVWTQLEVGRLKRLYAGSRPSNAELLAAFPGLNMEQIKGQARLLHLKRAHIAPVTLGVPILDAIRDKAFREGFSLCELDRLANTKRYFQKSMKQVCWRHICAAVDFLGGELRPAWYDEQGENEQALTLPKAA